MIIAGSRDLLPFFLAADREHPLNAKQLTQNLYVVKTVIICDSMPRGICVALRQRHLEALRLRLKGMSYQRAAEEAEISMDPFIVRLEQVRTRMERSNAILLRAFSMKRGLSEEFSEFARQLADDYSHAIKYGDLDAFHWLAQLMSRLANRKYPERGASGLPLQVEEEDLVKAYSSGQSIASYARRIHRNPNALSVVLARYRAKLGDAAANFVRLDSIAPRPHATPVVRKLRVHSEEFFAWAADPLDVDPAHLLGEALGGLWLQEIGLRHSQARAQLVKWMRGQRAHLGPMEVAKREHIELPAAIRKATRWERS